MIEPFRGDEQGAFPPGYFLSFSYVFLCFCSFVFSGAIRGRLPPYSTFSSFPKSFIGNPKVFLLKQYRLQLESRRVTKKEWCGLSVQSDIFSAILK